MFERPITLFTLLGFEIRVDLSWLVLASVITWSLATGLFPDLYKNLPLSSYWWMGAAGAFGLFLSIIIHELSHSLAARHFGIPMKSITLFIFGGVAEMKHDPPSPGAEFWMALVGPLASAALSLIMYLTTNLAQFRAWPVEVSGVLSYLSWLNLALAIFNLAPAFPLDGGRILRSLLWRWKKDLPRATSIASNVGSVFGLLLMAAGLFSFFKGYFVSGLWWLMIGYFVRMAAQGSYRQALAHSIFHHIKVRDVMAKHPLIVSRSLSLEEFVQEYVYRYRFQIYPVTSFGKFVGCVSVNTVSRVPKDEWAHHTVGSVTEPCGPDTSITPDESAEEALSVMTRTGNNLLLVVENDQLAGVVSVDDLLKLMSEQEAKKDAR